MTHVTERSPRIRNGRVWGWLSGCGVVIAPWLVAGVISTFSPDPEATFPWVLLGAFVTMVGWITFGSLRIPEFRRGALLGSALTLGVFGVAYLLILWFQP